MGSLRPLWSPALPPRFFVYGTLRDDDPSAKAPWNRDFVRGAVGKPATLPGFKLFGARGANFPFALRAGPSDRVVGRLLQWNESAFFVQQKVDAADHIEGFVAEGDPSNLYDRCVAQVEDAQGRLVPAIVYHMQPGKVRHAFEIAGGDWLCRSQRQYVQ